MVKKTSISLSIFCFIKNDLTVFNFNFGLYIKSLVYFVALVQGTILLFLQYQFLDITIVLITIRDHFISRFQSLQYFIIIRVLIS